MSSGYSDSYSDLPFFPKHETFHLQEDRLRITWFERKFSQCHFNYQNVSSASNACTLIAILMAGYCKNDKIHINGPDEYLNVRLIYLLAYSILDGNKIHEELRVKGILDNFNLTVPEAMEFAGPRVHGIKEWKSLIFMESLLETLFVNIKTNYVQWMKSHHSTSSELYVILIADNRSVLFILQDDSETATLIDSHQHSDDKGAFIAVALLQKLNYLCLWYSHVLRKCYRCDPCLYELSFLYFPKEKYHEYTRRFRELFINRQRRNSRSRHDQH